MIHQDSRPYRIAVAETKEKFTHHLNNIISRGTVRASSSVQDIMNEYSIRKDILVPGHSLDFKRTPEGIGVKVGEGFLNLTSHSYTQLLGRLGIPKPYVTRLVEEKDIWAERLLMDNLLTLSRHNVGDDRLLIREVGGTAKAVLSSSYRRMDAAPIFETFIEEGLKTGLVPIDGKNTNTRYHVKMLSKELYQPTEDEVVAFGMGLTTSDYGAGALQLQFFIMRVLCTNFMIGEDCLRKIHLGRRFNENEMFSQETYDLDTRAVASAVKDVLTEGVSQKALAACSQIEKAAETEINIDTALSNLRKTGALTKGQSETAKALYENVDEITMLPSKPGAWRFANVLSLMAQNKDLDGDKGLDLESEAIRLVA